MATLPDLITELCLAVREDGGSSRTEALAAQIEQRITDLEQEAVNVVLERLHRRVMDELSREHRAESAAYANARPGDATTSRAKANALDWVLQRLDEELGR